MINQLKIAVFQANIEWHNPTANLRALEEQLYRYRSAKIDLWLLPEMYSTGFTLKPAGLAINETPIALKFLKQLANQYRTFIAGSFIWKTSNRSKSVYKNRFLLISPNGTIEYYDKRHLFTLGGETKIYRPGTQKKIWKVKGWGISPFICYDLRFPEWCRNDGQTDLILFSANWPNTRIHHWKSLLTARAVENQCYVVGINRVGKDDNGLQYNGQSALIDANGDTLSYFKEKEAVQIFTLSKSSQKEIRARLPFLKDRLKG